jgi:hypothetical protein
MSDNSIPTVSKILSANSILEMVYRPEESDTAFAIFSENAWKIEPRLDLPSGERLIPYSPQNNLLAHKVVLLPSGPEEYESDGELLAEVRAFIHRYVAVSPLFEEIAAHYVLFTWIHDAFNELPYLRVRGDYGSGKSRFLLTVGSLCYKPMFTSGASTVSPIFRIIDAFRGTLVIDESDFRESDERAEIVKILNNGNAKGFPVLRCEVNQRKEFDPRAYAVFGPKLIATRRSFQDRALESRCLTEDMGQAKLRDDIPINLPASFEDEALHLRNQLLSFRARNVAKDRDLAGLIEAEVEPRLRQIFAPLLSTIEDEGTRTSVVALARQYQRELVADRGMEVEAQLLEILRARWQAGGSLSVKDITAAFADEHGFEYGRRLTPKWIGSLLRRRLGLRPQKSHGSFVLPPSEHAKLARLFERYGIDEAEAGGHGDIGDVADLFG